METPYITRSQQPVPTKEAPGKPELFRPNSEQAKRSILKDLAKDFESSSPRENLRAIGTLQNMNILEIRDGKANGLDKVGARIPGMESERNLSAMIEDGIVNPSKSMREMADRHGLEMPERRMDGPSPFREENQPENLGSKSPEVELQNPGLRELTTKLADASQQPTKDKAEASKLLDQAYSALLTPAEKELMGLAPEKAGEKTQEKETLPWLKSKTPTGKNEEAPIDPAALFNQAANALQKLEPDSQKEVMEKTFLQSSEKAQTNVEKESPLTQLIKNPTGFIMDSSFDAVSRLLGIDSKDKERRNDLPQQMEKNGVTPENALKDPIGTLKAGIKTLTDALLPLAPDQEKSQKVVKEINEKDTSKITMQEFLVDPLGRLTKVGASVSKEGEKPKEEEEKPKKDESRGIGAVAQKATDTLTTKSTPAMKGIKAGIEFFQEAASNKSLPEKMAGMTKAATKVVVSLAQGAGTKLAAGALATPLAPVAAVLMVAAVAAKFGKDSIMQTLLPKEAGKDQGEDKKSGLDGAIDTVFPNSGGKKGLAAKGIVKAGKATAGHVKDDLSGEKAKRDEKAQKDTSPEMIR